jgi:flagellar protein FliS
MPVVSSTNFEQSASSTRLMRVRPASARTRRCSAGVTSLVSGDPAQHVPTQRGEVLLVFLVCASRLFSEPPAWSLQTVRRATRPEPLVASHRSVRASARCDAHRGSIRRRTARRRRFRTLRGTRIRDLRLNLQARSFATHRRIDAVGHMPPPTVPRSSNCSTRNWSPPCAPPPVAPNSDRERADHARHRNPVHVRSRARFNKGGQVSEAVARLYCRARNTVINASPGHYPQPFRDAADIVEEIARPGGPSAPRCRYRRNQWRAVKYPITPTAITTQAAAIASNAQGSSA